MRRACTRLGMPARQLRLFYHTSLANNSCPLPSARRMQPSTWWVAGPAQLGAAGAAVGTTSSKPDAPLCRSPLPHLCGAHQALCWH